MAGDPHLLLLYEYVPDMVDRRGPHRDAHLERIRAEKDAGRVIMAGALGNPPTGGAIVFRGVDATHVDHFVADDPYVTAGLVVSSRVQPWNLV